MLPAYDLQSQDTDVSGVHSRHISYECMIDRLMRAECRYQAGLVTAAEVRGRPVLRVAWGILLGLVSYGYFALWAVS